MQSEYTTEVTTNDNFNNNALARPSRTIIVPFMTKEKQDIIESMSDMYTTLNIVSKKNKTGFIECVSVSKSIDLQASLIQRNIQCRFANYRLFLKITSDTSLFHYDEIKKEVKNKLYEYKDDLNILFFKLYKKDNRLTGNGYIVLDKNDDLHQLVKKNYACHNDKITFQLHNFTKKQNYKNINPEK